MTLPLYFGFVLVLFAMMGLSIVFRRRARKLKPGLIRTAEGVPVLVLRLTAAFPLMITLIVYVVRPAWMAWNEFDVPDAVRWAAMIAAIAGIALVAWVLHSIGANISETVLTKSDHELVTHGPYRWVRHPLYSVALLQIILLGLVTASVILIAYSLAGLVVFRMLVIPAEEAHLQKAFGEKYTAYRLRTWALVPWIT